MTGVLRCTLGTDLLMRRTHLGQYRGDAALCLDTKKVSKRTVRGCAKGRLSNKEVKSRFWRVLQKKKCGRRLTWDSALTFICVYLWLFCIAVGFKKRGALRTRCIKPDRSLMNWRSFGRCRAAKSFKLIHQLEGAFWDQSLNVNLSILMTSFSPKVSQNSFDHTWDNLLGVGPLSCGPSMYTRLLHAYETASSHPWHILHHKASALPDTEDGSSDQRVTGEFSSIQRGCFHWRDPSPPDPINTDVLTMRSGTKMTNSLKKIKKRPDENN